MNLARPRQPESLPQRLDRRRIYVLPTPFGLFVGALLIAGLLAMLPGRLMHKVIFGA